MRHGWNEAHKSDDDGGPDEPDYPDPAMVAKRHAELRQKHAGGR